MSEHSNLKPTSAPVIIGVAGGSGSGKTTVISTIEKVIGTKKLALLQHDAYYKDLSHLPFEERARQNFDHPSSLQTDLLIEHLVNLIKGKAIQVPVYDFTQHVRTERTKKMLPRQIILVDGLFIFWEPELRRLLDIKIFVDTDDDIRLLRRLRRDIEERGRSLDSVLNQYEEFVRPMHLEFVEPSKRYADIIIPRGGKNKVALSMVLAMIKDRL